MTGVQTCALPIYLALDGFKLWVHSYQFPEPTAYPEDNDWLMVSASYAAPDGDVWFERDPGLYVSDLSRWVTEVKLLRLGRMPQAVLASPEGLFSVVATSNGDGAYGCEVELDVSMASGRVDGSPSGANDIQDEVEPWGFEVTPDDLQACAAQAAAILAKYPTRR